MPANTSKAFIRQTTAQNASEIWNVLTRLESVVPAVGNIRKFQSNNTRSGRVIDWTVWLKGFELQWQEEQVMDANTRSIAFRQIAGMFAVYEGSWRVSSLPDGGKACAQIEVEVHFDSGLAHLSKYVNPVLIAAFESFFAELLHACIQDRAAAPPSALTNMP